MKIKRNLVQTSLLRTVILMLALLSLVLLAIPARSQNLLYSFTNAPDGATPESGLVELGNALYGTTYSGGTSNLGTIFKINGDGSGYTILQNFNGTNGANPYSKLLALNNQLFGTTTSGGIYDCGSIFRINPDGTGFQTIYSFTNGVDGYAPGNMVVSSNALVGTSTYHQGLYGGSLIFSINTDGSGFTVLASQSILVFSHLLISSNSIYGMINPSDFPRYFGGIFKMGTDGSNFTNIYSFTGTGSDGFNPSGLIVSGNSIYGTTQGGGSESNGVVFMLNTDGTGFADIYNFSGGSDGADPVGLILSGSTLYGATDSGGNSGSGGLFSLNPLSPGSGVTILTNFTSAVGAHGDFLPWGRTLYGTSVRGGNYGSGALFSVNLPTFEKLNIPSFSFYGVANLAFSGGVFFGTSDIGYNLQGDEGYLFSFDLDGTSYTGLNTFLTVDHGGNPPNVPISWYSPLPSIGAVSRNKIYGIVYDGSATSQNFGTSEYGCVFSENIDGTGLAELISCFLGPPYPYYLHPTSLVLSSNMLYGTTSLGGTNGGGAIFKMSTDGSNFTEIASFPLSGGSLPYSGILTNSLGEEPQNIIVSGNTLYGITSLGSTNGFGVVFKLFADGTGFSILKTFSINDGSGQSLYLSGNVLYGTTTYTKNVNETVVFTNTEIFSMNIDGSNFQAFLKNQGPFSKLLFYDGKIITHINNGSNITVNLDGTGLVALNDSGNPYSYIWGNTIYGAIYENLYSYYLGNTSDTVPPAVQITNPPASGSVIYGSSFIISGLASDNVGVAGVYYSLDGTTWTEATSGNGWTNWSANVSLEQGTNVVYAYAQDTSSNVSTIVSAQIVVLPPIAGETIGCPVNDSSFLYLNSGYIMFMPASLGNSYQIVGFGVYNGVSSSSGTYTYSTSGANGQLAVVDSALGSASGSLYFVSTNLGTMDITNPSDGGAEIQLYSGVALSSIAGQNISCTIEGGDASGDSGVFFPFGDVTLNFAATGNSYTATWGVALEPQALTSSGTYTFSMVNASTAQIQINNDSDFGTFTMYVAFSDSTHGRYGITQPSTGGFQFGSFVTSTRSVTAPTTIVGKTIGCPVNDSSFLFLNSGYIMFLPANSGNSYQIVGFGVYNGVSSSSGTYTYSTSGANAKLALADSALGSASGGLYFISTNLGTMTITNPSLGGAEVQMYSVTALQTITNSGFACTVEGGDGSIFPFSGIVTLKCAAAGNSYTLTGGNATNPQLVSSSGTYTYTKVNASTAQIQLNDSSFGVFSMYMAYSDPNYGKYGITQPSTGGFQYGTFTVIDTQPPVLNITNVISGMLVSNANYFVQGTATDNLAVASVYCQLNGTGWVNPTSFVGNNWSDSVTLNPGTNQFQAYAVDSSGNISITNTVNVVYVVSATLKVTTNGVGTLSPNDNGALLQVGKNYSITATAVAGSGFAFTNWTGGTSLPLSVITNGTTVQFLMVSNLMLQANFVDTNKPVVAITNITAGMQVSNASFTVMGWATDNVAVSSVNYNLSGTGWSNAVTGNNWTNWTAAVTLIPGTNTIAAYAMDTSGNVSTTNSASLFFVVTNQLQIRAIGLGTISPNYSNAWLEIGRNYSITSSPASGFIFTNWTISTNWIGGMAVTGTNLQFMMESNLTLQASFVETNRPTLTITAPTAGQQMTNALATVTGTTSDKWGVAGVRYQLNNAAWNTSATTNGWTNWTSTVELTSGTNTVKAYALNLGGIFSTTNSVSIVSSNTFMLQLTFSNSVPLKTNGLVFSLELSTGLNGHILVSTNLTTWTALTNFVGTNSTITFTDSAATNSSTRFYRAVIP